MQPRPLLTNAPGTPIELLPRMGTSTIAGVITSREVLLHGPAIVWHFGVRAYLRCLRALATRRQTTFLALVFADGL
jgi:hypothetical protein